jgi:microcystin-dependent protein
VSQNDDVIWDDIVGKPANLMTLDDAYPVGSLYISLNGALPPVGNWTKVQDGVFMFNDHANLGDTGGAATVTLTESEIPAHVHDGSTLSIPDAPNHEHDFKGQIYDGRGTVNVNQTPLFQAGLGYTNDNSTWGAGAHTHPVSGDTGSKGGGQAHENMPPFLAVSMWERTS